MTFRLAAFHPGEVGLVAMLLPTSFLLFPSTLTQPTYIEGLICARHCARHWDTKMRSLWLLEHSSVHGTSTHRQLSCKVGNWVRDLCLGDGVAETKHGLGVREGFLEEGTPVLCLGGKVGVSQLERSGRRKAFQALGTA